MRMLCAATWQLRWRGPEVTSRRSRSGVQSFGRQTFGALKGSPNNGPNKSASRRIDQRVVTARTRVRDAKRVLSRAAAGITIVTDHADQPVSDRTGEVAQGLAVTI
jgi:hypothetical protein